jgi:DNA modification methylase
MPKQPSGRKKTITSSFGTPGRVSHDSSRFYTSRLYEGIRKAEETPNLESPIPEDCLNRIFFKSSERMEELPDNSIHLMVTSPPYNASKEYDQDLNLIEYRQFLSRVWQETYRVLVPGGRACVNIANLGRKPYLPLHSYVIEDMVSVGFLMRGEIIWNKGSSASPSTAWGSWKSASNPVLRDTHEYILIFSKDTFKRKRECRENSINREDFLEWTKSVWSFAPMRARKIGHPAPFPEELPRRLIHLYSFNNDIVLDPFAGSGTTCLAALSNGRRFVAYEINGEYIKLANNRLAEKGKPI